MAAAANTKATTPFLVARACCLLAMALVTCPTFSAHASFIGLDANNNVVIATDQGKNVSVSTASLLVNGEDFISQVNAIIAPIVSQAQVQQSQALAQLSGAFNTQVSSLTAQLQAARSVSASLSTALYSEVQRASGVETAILTQASTVALSVAASLAREASRASSSESSLAAAATAQVSSTLSAAVVAQSVSTNVSLDSLSASILALMAGGQANPAASCSDLLLHRPAAPTGVYWLRPTLSLPAFQAYCDMATDGGGWTMVFKATGGSNVDPYTLWLSATTVNEGSTVPLTVSPDASTGYVNRFVVNNWNTGGVAITSARVHVYSGGTLQKFLKFNVTNSSTVGWFSAANYINSSWTDITKLPQNYFSLPGDPGNLRHFFIEENYGGCTSDNGWIAATMGTFCAWDSRMTSARPAFYYAPGSTVTNWQGGSMALGDVLAVFAR